MDIPAQVLHFVVPDAQDRGSEEILIFGDRFVEHPIDALHHIRKVLHGEGQ